MPTDLAPLHARDFGPRQAAHLLERAAFGAGPDEHARAVDEGPRATVERLFAASEGSAPRGDIGRLLGSGDLEPLQSWWMRGLCSGPGPLRERAVLMWHGHFATSYQKVRDVRLMHGQAATQRELALGPFRDLLRAMLVDPAMLVWLDGVENRVGAPNENLARELLELFGLGRGHYTEDDVREGARALTGWEVQGRRAVFTDALFDAGAKRFLAAEGPLDVDGAVDAVCAHPACAHWIAARLAHEYVGPRCSEELLAALAQDLADNGLHVGRTLERLLLSRAFHAPELIGGRIASGVELIARASRTLGVSLSPTRAVRLAERMHHSPFQPPTVAGWEGGRAWLDASAWVARRDFADELSRRAKSGFDLESACRAALPGRALPAWASGSDAPDGDPLSLVLGSPEFQLH